MDDVKDVDPEFLSRFEEEFKEHQDSVRKKKRARSFRHRKGSQTPGPSSLTTPQRRKKRKRPHSTKQEKGEQLPNVAWGTPRKDEEDPPHKEENTERLTDMELMTKCIQLPYLKQLEYVDMQLHIHKNLLETREQARADKQARIDIDSDATNRIVLPSPSPSQSSAASSSPYNTTSSTGAQKQSGMKEDTSPTTSPTTHSPINGNWVGPSSPEPGNNNNTDDSFKPMTLFEQRKPGSTKRVANDETMSVVSFGGSSLGGFITPEAAEATGTSAELKAASYDPAVVYKKYGSLLALVEPDAGAMYVLAASVGRPVLWEDMTVIPQMRTRTWFMQFIEEVYDGRFKFEYSEWREGPPKNKRPKRGEKKEEVDTDLDFEGVELHRSPDEFYNFVLSHIATQFGVRDLVRQVVWDLVFTIEALSDPDDPMYLEEARLFGFFLREIYPWKSLLFFLFCRDAVQSILRVQMSARYDKILDKKYVTRAAKALVGGDEDLLRVETTSKYNGGEIIPEHSMLVVTENHPVLDAQWHVLRLSKAACHAVCERVFHNDRVLAEYLFSSLLNPEQGDPRDGILAYALLLALLEDFRAIPDEFAASMQEDDTAETISMLQGLKEASGSDVKVAQLLVQIKEETLLLQEQKNVVSRLERDNDNNKNRTSIFLGRNELWRRQTVLETTEKALRALHEYEEKAWGSVIDQSNEHLRTLKADRAKRQPPTIPAALFNLGEVVELMHAWTKRRRENELRSMATLAKLKPLDVEAELERLRLKSVIIMQREWRARVAARQAKMEADKFLEIKRQQRQAKLDKQRKLDEAIAKRRAEAELKRQMALSEEKRRQQEEEERRLKAIRVAKLKVANEQTERKFAAKMKIIREKCFAAFKRYARTRILRRKVSREDTRRRFLRWHNYAKVVLNKKLFENVNACVIQRFARYIIARNILKHAKARIEKEQQIVRDFLRKMLNLKAHRAFTTWHHRAYQSARTRAMLKRLRMGNLHGCYDAWREATQLWVIENNASATKLQTMYRARLGRHQSNEKRRRRNAAYAIQRCVRAYSARRILHRAKKRAAHDQRRINKSLMRIKMRVESQTLLAWYGYVSKMRRVQRFIKRNMRGYVQLTFEHWVTYAKENVGAAVAAAKLIQKIWRGYVASRLGKKLLKHTRAAIVLQTFVRQFLETDTLDWLRLYRDAATEIQRMCRHLLAFNTYVRKRISNYFRAAEKGDYWTCNKAWERGEGEVVDEYGDNLLMCAARGGSKRVAKLCLRNGMDPNAYNKIGLTAIHHLVRANYMGQEVLLDYLMSKGCKHKSVDFSGATPLVDAARLGHMNCVHKLVESHADVNHRDNDGCSVVQVAAAANQLEVVEFLANECDADVGNIDNTGCTVLHDVATRGKYAMLGIIVPHLYDLNLQETTGQTALHLAVAGNHTECVRLLILAECDSNIIDNDGRTALHHAVFDHQIKIAELIAEGDTDLTIRDEDGDTALHAATISGHYEISKMLMGFGADHSIRNDNGDQPAHLAARKGHTECLKLMMEYEANMNMKNFGGLTPLGEARVNNNQPCIHLFDKMYINEAKAKAKFKKEKRRLALLNGDEPDPEHVEESDPTVALRTEDWRIEVPRTDVGWSKMRKKSILMRRIHKWMEYHYSNKEVLQKGNANHAEKCALMGRPPPTSPIYTVVFWYNTETDISVTDPPDDLVYGVWVCKQEDIEIPETKSEKQAREAKAINFADREINTRSQTYWLNDITGKRHDGKLPPNEIHTSQPRKMRVLPHLEAADVSSTDYKEFWESEMTEGLAKRKRLRACEMIQRQYRAYKARVYYAQLQSQTVAAIAIERVCRGFMGRVAAKDQKIKIKAVLAIQKNWRGRVSREQLEEMRAFMARRRSVLRASATINRCWRGYLCRRTKRRMIWRRDGPRFHDQWVELVELSTVRRIIGVWDEMICPETWDVLFYHNHVNRSTSWDKPDSVEFQDVQTWEDDRMLRLKGFTRAEDQASRWLQGIWRGRIIRRTFKFMVRGARIMRNCEDEYLSDPNNPVNLCNYMVYLHVERHDYNKARPLYARALEMMSTRGPDNAFILYAYAMFVTATREEDFSEILNYVERARVANKTGANRFNLAEKGFFRQAAVLNPNNGQSQANYAICIQFLRQDYKLAEEFYIRACEADPYDKGIQENFNNMLTHLAGKSYDGFDAFRKHQAKQAATVAATLAENIAHEQAQQILKERNEAAATIIKWFRSSYGKNPPVWYFDPPSDMVEEKRKAEAIKAAIAHKKAQKAAKKAAKARGEMFEDDEEDGEDWEMCSDGLGGEYYHCLLTGESTWEKPKFREGSEPMQGVGFEGLRGGKREAVDDWEECMDDQGKHYYFNVKTGRSQWVRPQFKEKHAHPRKGVGFGDTVDELHGGTDGNDVRPKEKPSLWQQHENEDNKTFWWHTATGESTWVKPNFMTDVEERRLNAEEKRDKEKEREEISEKLKPTEWELCFDDADQHYFYNTVTGTSSWDLDVDKEVEYALVSASMNRMEEQNRVEEQVSQLDMNRGAENWEEQLTDAGDKYFYNVVTGESSWTAPV
jgi:ankyrin repeat protein